MRLERNNVYERTNAEGKPELLRVLEIEVDLTMVIRTNPASTTAFSLTPNQLSVDKLKLVDDPFLPLRAVDDDELSPFQISCRDRANAAITHLIQKARREAPKHGMSATRLLFVLRHYFRLTSEVAVELKVPVITIRRWLHRWWQRGMNRNACLPDVEKMSGKGKTRAIPDFLCDEDGWPFDPTLFQPIGKRPTRRKGIRMTNKIRESILNQGKALYLADKQCSVYGAYIKWKDDVSPPEGRCPHPQAFYDVLKNDPEVRDAITSRRLFGRRKKEKPAIEDSMSSRVPGPGFRFQFDSTPLPIRVLNETTGEVGPKATLYFVLDTKVKGITGFDVGVKPACAQRACSAFVNAATDKVPFCKSFDIVIERSWWPMCVIPEEAVHDRGEWMGPVADILVNVFDVNLDNTPAYSPQLKADVEAAFGSVLRKVFSKLDEYVPPRPGRKLGLDGEFPPLTLREINVLLIWFVLTYNSRPLDRLPTPSEVKREVWTTPTGIWNAEHGRLFGNGKSLTQEEARLAVTKRGKGARIGRTGIMFEGLQFACTAEGLKSWQGKLQDKTHPIKIRYDEDYTDQIHVQVRELNRLGVRTTGVKPHSFVECKLTSDSCRWAGHTFPMLKEALDKHLTTMRPAYDHHEKLAAKLQHALAVKTTSSQLGKHKDSSPAVAEIAAAIEAREADRRIITSGPTASAPQASDQPSTSAVENVSIETVGISARNLAALRAGRKARQQPITSAT